MLRLGLCIPYVLLINCFTPPLIVLSLLASMSLFVLALTLTLVLCTLRFLGSPPSVLLQLFLTSLALVILLVLSPMVLLALTVALVLCTLRFLGSLLSILLRFFLPHLALVVLLVLLLMVLLALTVILVLCTLRFLSSPSLVLLLFFVPTLALVVLLVLSPMVLLPSFPENLSAVTVSSLSAATFFFSESGFLSSSDFHLPASFVSLSLTALVWGSVLLLGSDSELSYPLLIPLNSLPITLVFFLLCIRSPSFWALGFLSLHIIVLNGYVLFLFLNNPIFLSTPNLPFVIKLVFSTL